MNQAERLLAEEGLLSLPVDLHALAATRDMLVELKPDAAPGVSGILLRFGLGAYGRTLTVLTCKVHDETYGDDDDEEDEQTLVESWTPRFHRKKR